MTQKTALTYLCEAGETMKSRGQEYDKPSGERSMAATVEAFNAITGSHMEECDGWLFMLLHPCD